MTQCKAQSKTTGGRCKRKVRFGEYCSWHIYQQKGVQSKPEKWRAKQHRRNIVVVRMNPREQEMLIREGATEGFKFLAEYIRYLLFERRDKITKQNTIMWKEFKIMNSKIDKNTRTIHNMIGDEYLSINYKDQKFCKRCGQRLDKRRKDKSDFCYKCYQGRLKEMKLKTLKSKTTKERRKSWAEKDKELTKKLRKKLGLPKL